MAFGGPRPHRQPTKPYPLPVHARNQARETAISGTEIAYGAMLHAYSGGVFCFASRTEIAYGPRRFGPPPVGY
eukprot:1178-Rhodomonas_salina.4